MSSKCSHSPPSSSSCSPCSRITTATDNVPVLRASLSHLSHMPLQLLALPTDVLRLILTSHVVRYPLSHITARFVCRRFRDLLVPPLSQETRQQARGFC